MKTENKIKKILNDLRHFLNIDGGDIEFIKYENNILYDGGSFSTFAEMQEKMKGEYFDNLLTENFLPFNILQKSNKIDFCL